MHQERMLALLLFYQWEIKGTCQKNYEVCSAGSRQRHLVDQRNDSAVNVVASCSCGFRQDAILRGCEITCFLIWKPWFTLPPPLPDSGITTVSLPRDPLWVAPPVLRPLIKEGWMGPWDDLFVFKGCPLSPVPRKAVSTRGAILAIDYRGPPCRTQWNSFCPPRLLLLIPTLWGLFSGLDTTSWRMKVEGDPSFMSPLLVVTGSTEGRLS